MQDQVKIEEICYLLQNLTFNNEAYSDKDIGTHFDYDRVIELLQKANETMENTARNPRPADLPENIPWCETFFDPDEEFNPYVYDGSMSLEDHDKMVAAFETDRAQGIVNDHGEPDDTLDETAERILIRGNDVYKIKVFDVDDNVYSETPAFDKATFDRWEKEATDGVNRAGNESIARWTMFTYDREKRQWLPYSPDGKTILQYDSGRRANNDSFKIRYFDVHGNYLDAIESHIFHQAQLEQKAEIATEFVNGSEVLAGWTAYKFETEIFIDGKRQPGSWSEYQPDGKETLGYDTGLRGDHMAQDPMYRPQKNQSSPLMF